MKRSTTAKKEACSTFCDDGKDHKISSITDKGFYCSPLKRLKHDLWQLMKTVIESYLNISFQKCCYIDVKKTKQNKNVNKLLMRWMKLKTKCPTKFSTIWNRIFQGNFRRSVGKNRSLSFAWKGAKIQVWEKVSMTRAVCRKQDRMKILRQIRVFNGMWHLEIFGYLFVEL